MEREGQAAAAALIEAADSADQEKCIRLHALSAGKNAKFLLNQAKTQMVQTDQSIARIATRNIRSSRGASRFSSNLFLYFYFAKN